MNASASNCDGHVGRLLINTLELLDLVNEFHATDDSAKRNAIVVEEGQGCACRNVELSFVSVLQASTLAHAEHAALSVLHVEGFVFEFCLEHGSVSNGCLHSSALDVHAWDNAVNLRVTVSDFFAIRFTFKTLAKGKEVIAGLGSQVVIQFKHDLLSNAFTCDAHLGKLAPLVVIESVDLSLFSLILEVGGALFDLDRIIVQSPLNELLGAANVVAIVEHNQTLVLWVIVVYAL